jgi:hypothetical protein
VHIRPIDYGNASQLVEPLLDYWQLDLETDDWPLDPIDSTNDAKWTRLERGGTVLEPFKRPYSIRYVPDGRYGFTLVESVASAQRHNVVDVVPG